MKNNAFLLLLSFLSFFAVIFPHTAEGQQGETSVSSESKTTNRSSQPADDSSASVAPSRLLKNLVRDQKDIWTSPFKTRVRDLEWLIPMAGLTAGLIKADSDISSGISTTSFVGRHSDAFANTGVAAFVATGGGLYFIGRWKGNDHAQEAGILAGEAAVDSFLFDEVVKIATQRERPTDGTGQGRFWHGGSIDSSFPSDHAIAAWSIASVLAHEYPGRWTEVLAYGLATGVSVARVTGKQHFASDAFAGSAIGWLIGRQVYARHHHTESSGRDIAFTPILEQRTHAYGLHVEMSPTTLAHLTGAWSGPAK